LEKNREAKTLSPPKNAKSIHAISTKFWEGDKICSTKEVTIA